MVPWDCFTKGIKERREEEKKGARGGREKRA